MMDDFEYAMNNKWDKKYTYISFKNNFYYNDINYCLSLIIDNDNLDIFKIFCEKNIIKYISEEDIIDFIDSSKSKIKKWYNKNKKSIIFKNDN
jgi:thiamine pyrophosphokinase